ncbi:MULTISPECIES: NAD(P)/FAD-dependent oxidoreductase [Acidianus]|uniref:Pyridine nucleotide-disulfide oxidoreductase n=1 Tax=Candidatus Acidianus copahuensis TaxID=1160895 RepID=A0A031LM69_9CREN|nr:MULTISPECIES: FAD-dependent oxidoreductase [Acidianus]EZQ06743.1 pyridine nucleotide-disulfide oxidoreductase [Candidatus Acidianus copahuensis]NON61712.1 FAD-dependent oxidoreductase [Acidianus sp. RZ1]
MSEKTDYLIIGSGIAGYFAMLDLLKNNAKVTMVSSDQDYPYDRPPLSKEYLRGEIDKPYFNSPDYYASIPVKLYLNSEVEKIKKKEAILKNGKTIEFEKALIATGARPRHLSLEREYNNVFYLRTLRDCNAIKEALSYSKNPVIIGGGFIGVEAAASMAKLGKKPTVIEALPYIWSSFVSENVSKYVKEYLESKGVTILTDEKVKDFEGTDKVKAVITQSGKKIETDMILISIGVQPNVEIAENSEISTNNGILVNEYLETNVKDIYAAGDVANFIDPLSGKRKRIEHWNNAQYMGELAAKNMMGKEVQYNFLSTVWSDIFDIHIESGGETRDYDDSIVRGKIETNSFNVIYIKGGVVNGYVAFNRPPEELTTLNDIILKKITVSNKKDKISDEGYDLKTLL